MKRDFVVLFTCLLLLSSAVWASDHLEAVTAFSVPPQGGHTLVLDAGHGGEDGGAVSAAGDKESNINLAIVLRMDQLMGFCGVPVTLTRDTDRSIHDPTANTLREKKVSDLHNRVSMIEALQDALLVSIHQNSYPDPRYSGAQVFYGGSEDSQMWGEYVQEVLRTSLDAGNNRAAKPIPDTVYLMSHITCPAILVECGFMSNGEEVSLLLTPGYQKKMATALSGACLQYWNMTS